MRKKNCACFAQISALKIESIQTRRRSSYCKNTGERLASFPLGAAAAARVSACFESPLADGCDVVVDAVDVPIVVDVGTEVVVVGETLVVSIAVGAPATGCGLLSTAGAETTTDGAATTSDLLTDELLVLWVSLAAATTGVDLLAEASCADDEEDGAGDDWTDIATDSGALVVDEIALSGLLICVRFD